jgi:hypothetical protein
MPFALCNCTSRDIFALSMLRMNIQCQGETRSGNALDPPCVFDTDYVISSVVNELPYPSLPCMITKPMGHHPASVSHYYQSSDVDHHQRCVQSIDEHRLVGMDRGMITISKFILGLQHWVLGEILLTNHEQIICFNMEIGQICPNGIHSQYGLRDDVFPFKIQTILETHRKTLSSS